MLYGFVYGVPFGNHDWLVTNIATRKINASSNAYVITWIVNDECDGYYSVAINGTRVYAPVYCVAGVTAQALVIIPTGNNLISICPQGQFGDRAVQLQNQIDAFYDDGVHFADHFRIPIISRPVPLVSGTTQLTSPAVQGLRRGVNVSTSPGRKTWGVVDLTLTTNGGVHTIKAFVNGRVMLSGSRTGNGTITLKGAQASITLTLTYTGDFTSGVQLVCRWPESFKIYIKTSPFVDGDFPAFKGAAQLYDDGFSNVFQYQSLKLRGGTYYVVVHALGDDGLEGTDIEGGGVQITVFQVPDPATNLHYVSGDGAATIIGWDAPTNDATVTYHYYDSGVTGILNLTDRTGTVSAGSSPTLTLETVGTYTGLRFVIVRSFKSGIEEPSLNMLTLEYFSGVIVSKRPMPLSAGTNFSSTGRALFVPISFAVDSTLAYPYSVSLSIYPVGGSPDFVTPTTKTIVLSNDANTPVVNVDTNIYNSNGDLILNSNEQPFFRAGVVGEVNADGIYDFQVASTSAAQWLNAAGVPILNANGNPIVVPTSQNITGDVYGPVILTNTPMGVPSFSVVTD